MAVKLKPGAKVGQYEIESELSNGAFALSYAAKDRHGQKVFFKNYKSPSPLVTWYKGFVEHQGELKRRVESDPALKDRCYRFVEFFEHGPSYCQVFEFISGGMPLTECIEKKDEFAWEKMVVFAKVMMFAISYLHKVQIVHTDLKPDNVMLIPDPTVGMGYKLRLVDMDWAIFSDRKAPWHGEQGYIGTPGYQSPEHLSGTIPTEASDIFTCGLMLSEMLGEGHPFDLGSESLSEDMLAARCRPFKLAGSLPKVEEPEFVEAIINACFDPNPKNRPTASQIADALAGKKFEWKPTSAAKGGKPEPVVPKPKPSSGGEGSPAARSGAAPETTGRVSVFVNGEKLTSFGVDGSVGKNNFRHLGEASEARFLSDPQFELKKKGAGWVISPYASATNETIVNGARLSGEMSVVDGMIVSVGNSSKGVEKFPIELRFSK